MDLVSRHLLQQESFEGMSVSNMNATDPSHGAVTYRGFEFGVAVVMLMALGSCCLVTCCNCMRLGATILMGYGDRNERGGRPEQPVTRQRNERPIVVQHDWDPSDPADPVFIVLPDGGLSLAYQQPVSPSQKSIPLTEHTTPASPRNQLLCRLPLFPASIRSCVCAPSSAQRAYSADSGTPGSIGPATDWDSNRSQDISDSALQPAALADEAPASRRRSAERTARRSSSRSSSTPGHRRSRSARSANDPSSHHACRGRGGRNVEYCEVHLDGALLEQSLAETTAIVARGRAAPENSDTKESAAGGGAAPRCAIAVLLEGDESDSDEVVKGAHAVKRADAAGGPLAGVVVVEERLVDGDAVQSCVGGAGGAGGGTAVVGTAAGESLQRGADVARRAGDGAAAGAAGAPDGAAPGALETGAQQMPGSQQMPQSAGGAVNGESGGWAEGGADTAPGCGGARVREEEEEVPQHGGTEHTQHAAAERGTSDVR
eukprot:jgi/Ulvmu1/11484/UM077_0033.1